MLSPMNKISKAMEFLWLALGIILLVWVLYAVHQGGFAEQKTLFLFPILCFAMFFFRRFMRNKIQLMENRKSNEGQ